MQQILKPAIKMRFLLESIRVNQESSAHSSNRVKQKRGVQFPSFKKKNQQAPLLSSERWEKIQWERIPLEELLDRQEAELHDPQLENDQSFFDTSNDQIRGFLRYPRIDELLQYQRAELLVNLVTTLGLRLLNWGNTFDKTPHEAVEIIVALGSAGVITDVVNIIKIWLEKDKIDNAIITLPNGINLDIKRATVQEIQNILETVNQLSPERDNKDSSLDKPNP